MVLMAAASGSSACGEPSVSRRVAAGPAAGVEAIEAIEAEVVSRMRSLGSRCQNGAP